MYSVVLMVAMTSSVELPDCHRKGGRGRGHGCGCAPAVSYGYGCGGYGGGYGCAGYGGIGGYGGYGCVGGVVEGGTVVGGGGGTTGGDAPLTTEEQKKWDDYVAGLEGEDKKTAEAAWEAATTPKEKRDLIGMIPSGEVKGPAPARLVVKLPARARLTIGGAPTTSTSASRTFVSPVLEPGRNYYYTLQATYIQDGKPVIVKRIVSVRAGQFTAVSLNAPRSTVATAQR